MPNQTNSKRISISLNPELYAVVSDLAELQNKPMSRIVVELMEEMSPVLESVRDGLKEVRETNDKTAVLKRIGGALLMDGTEQLGNLSKELKNL
jgi:predicted DNA-binding protein